MRRSPTDAGRERRRRDLAEGLVGADDAQRSRRPHLLDLRRLAPVREDAELASLRRHVEPVPLDVEPQRHLGIGLQGEGVATDDGLVLPDAALARVEDDDPLPRAGVEVEGDVSGAGPPVDREAFPPNRPVGLPHERVRPSQLQVLRGPDSPSVAPKCAVSSSRRRRSKAALRCPRCPFGAADETIEAGSCHPHALADLSSPGHHLVPLVVAPGLPIHGLLGKRVLEVLEAEIDPSAWREHGEDEIAPPPEEVVQRVASGIALEGSEGEIPLKERTPPDERRIVVRGLPRHVIRRHVGDHEPGSVCLHELRYARHDAVVVLNVDDVVLRLGDGGVAAVDAEVFAPAGVVPDDDVVEREGGDDGREVDVAPRDEDRGDVFNAKDLRICIRADAVA
jgi:hypothetical protein